jgi:hypothetical protein
MGRKKVIASRKRQGTMMCRPCMGGLGAASSLTIARMHLRARISAVRMMRSMFCVGLKGP